MGMDQVRHAGVSESLDPTGGASNIEAGARMETPLWLAVPLASQQILDLR